MTIVYFGLAALFEIAGCFAFWSWLRQGRSPLLAAAGTASLILLALCLTRVDAAFAGRAFRCPRRDIHRDVAGLALARRAGQPDRWDLLGGMISVAGA